VFWRGMKVPHGSPGYFKPLVRAENKTVDLLAELKRK
jgi:hypothetical protein